MYGRIVLMFAFAAAAAVSANGQTAGEKSEKSEKTEEGAGLMPRVKLVTSLGDIVIELNGEKAPITVDNFLRYVKEKYYDGTIFHRVVPTFMIQGGGFTPEMEERTEGRREPIFNEWRNGLKNKRGTIAMARTAQPNSATAQFFINVVDNDRLDSPHPRTGNAAYAVFGKVVEGLDDAVQKIRNTPTTTNSKLPMGKVVPIEPIVIKSIEVIGKYDEAKLAAAAAAAQEVAEKEAEAKRKAAEKAADAKRKAAEEARKAVAAKTAAAEKGMEEFFKKVAKDTGKPVQKTASGMRYVVLKKGDGPLPKPTDTVMTHYTGWLTNGTKFDSSVDKGQPLPVNLRGGVIRGWLEALATMKVGEKRKLIIPPNLAYGPRGRPPTIPPNSWLVFDVEMMSIK